MKNPALLVIPALAFIGFGIGDHTIFGALGFSAIGAGIGCFLVFLASVSSK